VKKLNSAADADINSLWKIILSHVRSAAIRCVQVQSFAANAEQNFKPKLI
jgi:hypothetical protein